MNKNKPIKPRVLGRRDLKRVHFMIENTLPHEIDCDQCQSVMEVFAEETLHNLLPGEVTKAAQEHIERCMDCSEEYKVLLTALKRLGVS